MKNKFVCIHGHFYQPPRENPWLGEVAKEESAAPFHDWNERILAECYAPNAATPILDEKGQPSELLSTYEHISFNFGPTLLSWMERRHPEAYANILDADRRSAARRGGHGNAIAQAYNHMIMPLASRRDKVTQIRWGIADFRSRFGREPEGLWLPETAVDEETLETLVQEGVRFTILSPHQAGAVRPIGAANAAWTEVSESPLDTTKPYRWFSRETPSGFVDIFFFHRPVSNAVSFERLLDSGANFIHRLAQIFQEDDGAQLANIATDGEIYGHHHRFGNMALAYAVRHLPEKTRAAWTNYGEFLSESPPELEVRINPDTSWSCSHGIRRWRDDCGCQTGAHPEWKQSWRKPLREALDWLAAEIDRIYEERSKRLFTNAWDARNDYVAVLLGSDPADRALSRGSAASEGRLGAARFPPAHLTKRLSPEEEREALELCEMQKNRLFMFTSCGWFFDDIAGLEAAQILKYAARAIELSGSAAMSLEKQFVERLSRCPSNLPEFGDGAAVYSKLVLPLREGNKEKTRI